MSFMPQPAEHPGASSSVAAALLRCRCVSSKHRSPHRCRHDVSIWRLWALDEGCFNISAVRLFRCYSMKPVPRCSVSDTPMMQLDKHDKRDILLAVSKPCMCERVRKSVCLNS